MAGALARVDDDDDDARHAEWQQTLIYNDIIPPRPSVTHTHTHTNCDALRCAREGARVFREIARVRRMIGCIYKLTAQHRAFRAVIARGPHRTSYTHICTHTHEFIYLYSITIACVRVQFFRGSVCG